MHSTEWMIQVVQRPPGTSKPLPDTSQSIVMSSYVKAAYNELGGPFSNGRGSSKRKRNLHFLLRHESQALFFFGFEEDMGAFDWVEGFDRDRIPLDSYQLPRLSHRHV